MDVIDVMDDIGRGLVVSTFFRAEYSLANESTVAINGAFSTGEKSEWGEYVPININSEFGQAPSLSVSSLTIICD